MLKNIGMQHVFILLFSTNQYLLRNFGMQHFFIFLFSTNQYLWKKYWDATLIYFVVFDKSIFVLKNIGMQHFFILLWPRGCCLNSDERPPISFTRSRSLKELVWNILRWELKISGNKFPSNLGSHHFNKYITLDYTLIGNHNTSISYTMR